MNRREAITRYKAAIAVFRQWLEKGFISPQEFVLIDTKTAEKYGISSTSIYRETGPDSFAMLSIQSDK